MDLDRLAIDTIRTLSMDAVQKANSGHPGTPMALAPLSHVLWSRFISYHPKHPQWFNRDRFILSCGHASMLLYSQLYLAGFDLSLDDLKQFRQWGSKTPGHPEYRHTSGVETTTGPLGQGFANAVGMAIAEKHMAAQFNRPGHTIVDHCTYVVASDGDLMEGIAAEAASLAGHLALGKLIAFYDDNNITIDGSTHLAFSEDVGKRFEAYGWHVQRVKDANDLRALEHATTQAKAEKQRPSLIIVSSHIAFGSPNKQDRAEAHGSPLGENEVQLTKRVYGWTTEHLFDVPKSVLELYAERAKAGERMKAAWDECCERYQKAHPDAAKSFHRVVEGRFPEHWEKGWPIFSAGDMIATRQASHRVMQHIAQAFTEFIGGSADLAGSNLTHLKSEMDVSAETPQGRNIHFGIREHAMGGIVNGLALHGGLVPFAATFLIFSDYMRPAIRLAAMMRLPTRYIFTHDSIGLGEDGPTHQPIEHLMSLRAIPGLTVLRPADAKETAGAWQYAMEHRTGPVVFSLTRQKVPTLSVTNADGVSKGAYVLAETTGRACELLLIATGSEVGPAYEAWQELDREGIATRLVSMPSWEIFAGQSKAYQESILPVHIQKRISIEAGTTLGWERYIGSYGASMGIDRFGASAPAEVNFEKFGLTKDAIVARAKKIFSE